MSSTQLINPQTILSGAVLAVVLWIGSSVQALAERQAVQTYQLDTQDKRLTVLEAKAHDRDS